MADYYETYFIGEEMNKWQDYGDVFNDLKNRLTKNQQLVKSTMSILQEVRNENDMIRNTMERLALGENLQDLKHHISRPVIVAVADGMEVDENRAKKMDIRLYDVIMDIPEECLKIKRKQKHKITFEPHKLNLLGPKRIALLEYMLEHPKTTISINNIHEVPKYDVGLSPNSLAKAKKDLCNFMMQAAEEQPYIINTPEISAYRGMEQTTGYGYKINPYYKCLVVLKNF